MFYDVSAEILIRCRAVVPARRNPTYMGAAAAYGATIQIRYRRRRMLASFGARRGYSIMNCATFTASIFASPSAQSERIDLKANYTGFGRLG